MCQESVGENSVKECAFCQIYLGTKEDRKGRSEDQLFHVEWTGKCKKKGGGGGECVFV